MKVLFAVSHESISEGIVKMYQKQYKEILSYKNVYYFNAILKEIQRDKTYDRIVISEDLESFSNNNYDAIDKFIFEKLDNISDEAEDINGNETTIILICSERHTKGSSFLVKLFGIGIYNALLGNERSREQVCRLINKPRVKKEAKLYYNIDSDDVNYSHDNENEVSETEINNILNHFKKLGKNTEKYAESFNNIASQYNNDQLKIIINCLPMTVKAVLEADCQKYQEIMSVTGIESVRKLDSQNKAKDNEKKTGIKLEIIENKLSQSKISGPIVIPSSIKTSKNKGPKPMTNRVDISIDQNLDKKMKDAKRIEKVPEIKIEKKPTNLEKLAAKREDRVEKANPPEKKKAVSLKDLVSKVPAETIEDEDNSGDMEEKRGRGRPRKTPIDSIPKPKGKRGRPRKVEEAEDEEEEFVLPGMDDDFDDEVQTFPTEEESFDDELDDLPGLDDFDDDFDADVENQFDDETEEDEQLEFGDDSDEVEEVEEIEAAEEDDEFDDFEDSDEIEEVEEIEAAEEDDELDDFDDSDDSEGFEEDIDESEDLEGDFEDSDEVEEVEEIEAAEEDDEFDDFEDSNDAEGFEEDIDESEELEDDFEDSEEVEEIETTGEDEFDDLEEPDSDATEELEEVEYLEGDEFDDLDESDEEYEDDFEDADEIEEVEEIEAAEEDEFDDLDESDEEYEDDFEDADEIEEVEEIEAAEEDEFDDLDEVQDTEELEEAESEEPEETIESDDYQEGIEEDNENEETLETEEVDLPELDELDNFDEISDDEVSEVDESDEKVLEAESEDVDDDLDSGFEDDDFDAGFDDDDFEPDFEDDDFEEDFDNDLDSDADNDVEEDSGTLPDIDDSEEDLLSDLDDTSDDSESFAIPNISSNASDTIESVKPKVDYSMSSLNSLLTKDKKIVTFIGTTKNGTSFLVNNLAALFSSAGINTAILDMTKNKNSYYIYTNNEEELRNTAFNSISKLQKGFAEGIKVNKSLSVYTALPNDGKDYSDAEPILSTLIQNHSLVLIDCDYDTDPSYFACCQEIYLVQSMDILTIQPLTAFLRDLKAQGVLESEKVRVVINKELKVKNLSEKVIIGGMSFYNDPSMSFMTELFNKDMVKFCSIPFDQDAYSKYLYAMAECNVSLSNYSKPFLSKLKVLSDMVYPLSGAKAGQNSNFGKMSFNK